MYLPPMDSNILQKILSCAEESNRKSNPIASEVFEDMIHRGFGVNQDE